MALKHCCCESDSILDLEASVSAPLQSGENISPNCTQISAKLNKLTWLVKIQTPQKKTKYVLLSNNNRVIIRH